MLSSVSGVVLVFTIVGAACLVAALCVLFWSQLVKAIPDEVDQQENRLWQERCKEIAGAYKACEAEKGKCECKRIEILKETAKPSVN